jgi:hypothetical protein
MISTFRIQRMFRPAVPALLAVALLLAASLPAAAAGPSRSSTAGAEPSWMDWVARVSAWIGGRLDAGWSVVWGEDGSSFDPNGRPAAARREDGSSIDPDGRIAVTSGDYGSSIDPDGRP